MNEGSTQLNADQVNKLRTFIQNQADEARKRGTSRPIMDELIVFFMLDVGLKPIEICSLDIDDYVHGQEPSQLYIRSHGGTAARHVDLPPTLEAKLTRYTHLHRPEAAGNAPLLISERGSRLAYASIYSKIKRLAKITGLVHLTPNTLRHTYIVSLFEKEQDLLLVQQKAGHASHKTTSRCIQLNTTSKCEACSKKTTTADGIRIDSGQFICNSCLADMRGG